MKTLYRPYTAADRADCMALFRSNVPRYFHADELSDYEDCLDHSGCAYYVIEQAGQMVACGGFQLSVSPIYPMDGLEASLYWGMVRRDVHHQRLGSQLLLARLHAIVTTTRAQSVRLATSQHTQGFYRRFGFEVEHIQPDGCAPGLDEVEMRLILTDAAKARVLGAWATG